MYYSVVYIHEFSLEWISITTGGVVAVPTRSMYMVLDAVTRGSYEHHVHRLSLSEWIKWQLRTDQVTIVILLF